MNLGLGLGFARRPAGADVSFLLTVPSGTVGSNLAAFVLPIDLAQMPSLFWSAVQEDGGNIRAYAADGVTMIPHDIYLVNTADEKGSMFVRHNMLAASDVEIVIKLTVAHADALPVGDTNGRHAVWSDYEAVYMLGHDPTDRSGKSAALRIVGEPAMLALSATSGDINCHEGVATDGANNYGFDSFVIRKFDLSWGLITSTASVSGTYSNGLGGGCVHDGVIYIAADNGGTQYLARYDAATLTRIDDFNIESFANAAADFCWVDGEVHTIPYLTTPGAGSIIRIDPDTGANLGSITLSLNIIRAQGITFWRGAYWITCFDTDNIYRVEPDGTVTVNMWGDATSGDTLEGLDVTPDGNGLIVLRDSGATEVVLTFRDHALSLSAGGGVVKPDTSRLVADLASSGVLGSAWTVGASIQQESLAQRYFLGLVPTGAYSATQSVHIGVDEISSQYRLAAYDGSNSWLYSATNQQVSTSAMKRVNVAYNGTTARYLWVNGADKGTDNTITARSTGIAHLNIGAAIENAMTDAWAGRVGFVYARQGVLSDAWIAAEYASLNNPAGFYTIT